MRKIIIAALAAILLPGLAFGQDNVKKKVDKVLGIGDGASTAAASASGSNDKLAQVLAKPFQDLAAFISRDDEAAITLSTVIPTLQDGHGQQCWIAARQFTAVINAHPIPITLHAMTDLQGLRLLTMAANNLCADPHCTQVFADLATGVQVAAPINASIPIPSLHDICAKIPQVAVVPPILPVPPAPVAATPPPAATPPK